MMAFQMKAICCGHDVYEIEMKMNRCEARGLDAGARNAVQRQMNLSLV